MHSTPYVLQQVATLSEEQSSRHSPRGTPEPQGLPPLAEHTLTDTHSCARLLATFADQLVVAHTPGSNLPSVLYVVDPATGLISGSRDRIMALSMQVADQLLPEYDERDREAHSEYGQYGGPEGLPSRAAVINHARGLRSSRAPEKHQNVVGGVLMHGQEFGGTLAARLTVRPHSALDADMSVIGTPKGVLDIRTLRILPPTEASSRFISRTTGVEYRQDARDPRVARILPSPSEVDHQSRTGFIMRWIGWHMTHPPQRDFLGLISEGNSGKSTLVNTLLAGLGDYAHVIRPQALAGGRVSSHPTSHNDELLLLGRGRRLVFLAEAGHHHGELLNLITGGDLVPTRPIRRATVEVTVTAGLAIIGNTPGRGQTTGAVLGIGGDDDVSAALRDRARIVRLPRRGAGEGNPPDDLELATAAKPGQWTQGFREAALARILEWAVVMVDQQDPPEPTVEMVMDQAVQEAAEQSGWLSEFIPRILTTDPDMGVLDEDGTGQSAPRAADSYGVYLEYLAWHRANGGARPPVHRRAVTDALLSDHPELKGIGREGKIPEPGGGPRHKTIYFPGYFIRDMNLVAYR